MMSIPRFLAERVRQLPSAAPPLRVASCPCGAIPAGLDAICHRGAGGHPGVRWWGLSSRTGLSLLSGPHGPAGPRAFFGRPRGPGAQGQGAGCGYAGHHVPFAATGMVRVGEGSLTVRSYISMWPKPWAAPTDFYQSLRSWATRRLSRMRPPVWETHGLSEEQALALATKYFMPKRGKPLNDGWVIKFTGRECTANRSVPW